MITTADIDRVARQHDLPLWLAAGIAADVVLRERIRAERRRFPRLESRRARTALLGHLLEQEAQQ
jgi:hypothetical protein